MRMNGRPVSQVGKASLIPFFVLHYGIFWVVHGVFVLTLPLFAAIGADGEPDFGTTLDPLAILFVVACLVISHGVSYVYNYIGRGEYLRTTAAGQMFAPYSRLVVLHVTIIIGAIAIGVTGASAIASSSSCCSRSRSISACTWPSIVGRRSRRARWRHDRSGCRDGHASQASRA
jgi:hypothetical protein